MQVYNHMGATRAGEDDSMNTVDIASANNTTLGHAAPQMMEKLGNTTYDVYIHFSQTSKETLTDKVMRLIRNEIHTADIY